MNYFVKLNLECLWGNKNRMKKPGNPQHLPANRSLEKKLSKIIIH